MDADLKPTPEDLARDLLADLRQCQNAKQSQRQVAQTQQEQGQDWYLCGAVASLGLAACDGWPATIRRAIAAEAEVVRLCAVVDAAREIIRQPPPGPQPFTPEWDVWTRKNVTHFVAQWERLEAAIKELDQHMEQS